MTGRNAKALLGGKYVWYGQKCHRKSAKPGECIGERFIGWAEIASTRRFQPSWLTAFSNKWHIISASSNPLSSTLGCHVTGPWRGDGIGFERQGGLFEPGEVRTSVVAGEKSRRMVYGRKGVVLQRCAKQKRCPARFQRHPVEPVIRRNLPNAYFICVHPKNV